MASATPRTPREWLRLAMGELRGAEQAYGHHNGRGGLLGCKRAAGMALRGMLLATPDPSYGRSYVDHVAALARDITVPEAVRAAAKLLYESAVSSVEVVMLRPPKANAVALEAARDVMAHAYAMMVRVEARAQEPS